VGIKADPVHVIVDEDRAKVFEPGSRRVLRSVRLESTESIGSVPEHVVNARTLAQVRSAPVDVKKDAELEVFGSGQRSGAASVSEPNPVYRTTLVRQP